MIVQLCDWLEATPLSQTLQGLTWFVPLVQTIHILSIAVVMTSVGTLDFKLLGLAGRAEPLSVMVSTLMPWIWSALVMLLVSGALLTVTEPSRELMNAAFRVKMLMVLVIASMLLLLQRRLQRDPNYWGLSRHRRGAARAIGAGSLVLLVGIVVAGRWIAYI